MAHPLNVGRLDLGEALDPVLAVSILSPDWHTRVGANPSNTLSSHLSLNPLWLFHPLYYRSTYLINQMGKVYRYVSNSYRVGACAEFCLSRGCVFRVLKLADLLRQVQPWYRCC